MTVTNMSDKSGKARHANLALALRDLADAAETSGSSKAFAVILKEDGSLYDWTYKNINMRASEVISLLEIVKAAIIEDMNR